MNPEPTLREDLATLREDLAACGALLPLTILLVAWLSYCVAATFLT